MARLTTRDFWDSRHKHRDEKAAPSPDQRRGVRGWLDAVRRRVGARPMVSYNEFLFQRKVAAHLPRREDWTLLEVGAAPGNFLVDFRETFGYEPYGVEYSPTGAEEARRTLEEAGVGAGHIVEADFFDSGFQSKYAGRFDVVLSRGFIEHFEDPAEVVRDHVNVLKPGGYLVCSVPNLKGWTYPLLRLFGRDLLRAHNCSIMRMPAFRRVFESASLKPVLCQYVGLFNLFGSALGQERTLRGLLFRLVNRGATLLDHLLFVALRGWAAETRWSPQLVYIGRKLGDVNDRTPSTQSGEGGADQDVPPPGAVTPNETDRGE